MAADLNDKAMLVAAAAEKKDLDAMLKAGGEMYNACTACHEKYIPAE
jgi:cytochrome c556